MIGWLRDARDATGIILFSCMCLVGLMVIVGGLSWAGIEISNAMSNSTAKSTGNAQVKRDTDSGANQEVVSAVFSQLHEQIAQYQAEIKQQKTPPPVVGSLQAEQLTALEQTCQTAVQQYNADVETNTMGGLLPVGWPKSYPYTSCE